jgi:alkylation response protein AidB-like acyl-CoA dehydrogenase
MVGAARAHAARVLAEVHEQRLAGEETSAGLEAELRAAGTWATEVAVDVAQLALKYSGGTGVRQASAIQRVVREALVAQSHVHVVDTNYDNLGLALLRAAGAEGVDAVRVGYR